MAISLDCLKFQVSAGKLEHLFVLEFLSLVLLGCFVASSLYFFITTNWTLNIEATIICNVKEMIFVQHQIFR